MNPLFDTITLSFLLYTITKNLSSIVSYLSTTRALMRRRMASRRIRGREGQRMIKALLQANGTPYTDDQWKGWYTQHKSSDEMEVSKHA